jgi:hypothetical protein
MQRVKAVGKLVADGVRLTSSVGDNAVKRGRLAFVTKVLNRIEESKDPAFARRQEAADELVVIQAEMFRGFERVTGLFHEIGKEVEGVTRLLEQFRAAVAIHNHDHTAGLMLSPGDEPRVKKLDDEVSANASRLVHLAESASSTLKNSCAKMIHESMNYLRIEGGAATTAVRDAQVSMDLARSDLVAAEGAVDTARHASAEAHGGSHRGGESPSVELEKARQSSSRREAALNVKKGAYDATLKDNREKLDYTLDQVTMATWACFNVFFTEISNFLSESAPVAKVIATSIRI